MQVGGVALARLFEYEKSVGPGDWSNALFLGLMVTTECEYQLF